MGEPRELSDMSLIDTADLLLYVFVTPDGMGHMGGKTRDWEWVAASLRTLAARADEKARRAPGFAEPNPVPEEADRDR